MTPIDVKRITAHEEVRGKLKDYNSNIFVIVIEIQL